MDHPPSCRQKLPAFFHGLTFLENSRQPKKKVRLSRDNPLVGCAPRTTFGAKDSRGRLSSINLAKK
jgi:hypothetical protein